MAMLLGNCKYCIVVEHSYDLCQMPIVEMLTAQFWVVSKIWPDLQPRPGLLQAKTNRIHNPNKLVTSLTLTPTPVLTLTLAGPCFRLRAGPDVRYPCSFVLSAKLYDVVVNRTLFVELLMQSQDKVALLAWNGRFISAPEDHGRVHCLSEKVGEREMVQVGSSYVFVSANTLIFFVV